MISKLFIVLGFSTFIGSSVALWSFRRDIRAAERRAAHQRLVPRHDVYLTRSSLFELLGGHEDGARQESPGAVDLLQDAGWDTTQAARLIDYENVILSRNPVEIRECAGVWLRTDGRVLLVEAWDDPVDVLRQACRVLEAGKNATHVYLSRRDVLELAHHHFYIPMNHGYHRRHVARRYPGWSWEELHTVLHQGGCLSRRGTQEVAARHLPAGCVGVLIGRDRTFVLDDGSLRHPAKAGSGERVHDRDTLEHSLIASSQQPSPVIVHAPHISRHIPQDVRRELLVDDAELRTELDRMTDLGVADVLDGLSPELEGVGSSAVTATFSRLVFDPERFPDGDEMEAVGMGVVYTQCADGAPLRDALPAERLDWYRAQHRAYTNSFEQVTTLAVERFGSMVIVDLHSYPQYALEYEDATRRRPQVCVGTDPEHTPEWLRTLAEDVLGDRFDTGVNTPFSGAYVPGELYGTDPRVFSVMLEFRRDVLTDPRGLEQAIEAVREIVRRAGEIVRTRAEATHG